MSGSQEADSWREVIAKARSPFVRKLWMMLHTAEIASVISFDADGTSFSIHDTEALQATVLPKWFKSALLKTFQRQLNYFGFTKSQALSTKDKLTYSMPLFKRGDPESVLLIQRKCNTGNLTAQQRCKRKVLVLNVSSKKAKSNVARADDDEDGDVGKWGECALQKNSEEEVASGLTALCWLATQAIDARQGSPWKQVRRHPGSANQLDKAAGAAAPWAVHRGGVKPRVQVATQLLRLHRLPSPAAPIDRISPLSKAIRRAEV